MVTAKEVEMRYESRACTQEDTK